MDFLELVQHAVEKSGAREDEPSTIVGATGMLKLFVNWVIDAWTDLQLESNDWWFRQVRNQTLPLVDGTDEYAFPSGLDAINERTVSVYQSGQGVDESPVTYIDYEDWRVDLDTRNFAEAKPTCFTISPDDMIIVFPVPDDSYTLRFDGVRELETLDNTDDSDTPTGLTEKYHPIIYWSAVMKYAAHYEDGSKLIEAQQMFDKYHKRIEARKKPKVRIDNNQFFRNRRF